MKERPILFSAPMVRAILESRKSQTRRIVKAQPAPGCIGTFGPGMPFIRTEGGKNHLCPYGAPGDRLWVRETWRIGAWNEDKGAFAIDYCDGPRRKWITDQTDYDGERFNDLWIKCCDELHEKGIKPNEDGNYIWLPGESPLRWRPSIHMPRWASRINLEITGARVERLKDISEEDAKAEGIKQAREPLTHLWNADYPDRGCGTSGDDKEPGPIAAYHHLWTSINGIGSWDANPWVWVVEFKAVEAAK